VQRLKARSQFQAVLSAEVIAKTAHFALHRHRFSEDAVFPHPPVLFPLRDIWIGAMVPKRWARRAATRNTIKRQIYTVSAHFQHRYQPAALVVRLRSEFARREFVSATSDLLKHAVRAEVTALMEAGALAP
jgi:ribonuclease P protein component